MKTIGTFEGKIIGSTAFSVNGGGGFKTAPTTRFTDAAVKSNMAFLESELEKRDTRVREPLTSVTYTRDVPIKTGGGWVDTISAMNIDYGVTGGSGDGLVHAGGANGVPVVQANLDKDLFHAIAYSIVMRIMYLDMQKQNITGRSLDTMLKDGIRLSYDKFLDQNTYIGMSKYNTTGLLNNADVVATNVATGAGGGTTWATKTPDEILKDVNTAIEAGWAAGEYDLAAIPNHILLPYAQYNYIATQKVTDLAEKTILTFLMENNVATKNGSNLIIGATAYCKGAGAGATDRMAAYVHNDRFMAMEELVPLSRTMTAPNVEALAYDSVYMANVSEVEIFYNQVIVYYDGI